MKKRHKISKRKPGRGKVNHIKLSTHQSMMVLAVNGLDIESDDADHIREIVKEITIPSNRSNRSSSVRIFIKIHPRNTTYSLNILRHSFVAGLLRCSSHTRSMLPLYLFTLSTSCLRLCDTPKAHNMLDTDRLHLLTLLFQLRTPRVRLYSNIHLHTPQLHRHTCSRITQLLRSRQMLQSLTEAGLKG